MWEGVERWMGRRGLTNEHGRAIFQEEYRSNLIRFSANLFSSSEDEEFPVMKNDYKKVFSSRLIISLLLCLCSCSCTKIDFEFVRNERWFWLFRITHTASEIAFIHQKFYSDRKLLSDTWRINEILLRHEDSWREKRRARVARRFFEGFTIYHERGDMLLFRMNRKNLNEVKIHSFLVSTMNTNYKRWVISDSSNWSRQKTFSSSSCVALVWGSEKFSSQKKRVKINFHRSTLLYRE